MNPLRTADAVNLVSRILAVFAVVVILCQMDRAFDTSVATRDDAPELLIGSWQSADPRLGPLADFIQNRFRTANSVAVTAAYAALQSSRDTGLPATLILAVAAVESSFKPLSDNGHDKGIMQVNPKWHPKKMAAIGGAAGLFDVALGIKTGALILKEYSEVSKSDVVLALLRYNGATSYNEYPNKVLAEKQRFDQVLAQNLNFSKKPPCTDSSSSCYISKLSDPNRGPI